jgi:hypothetical protein
MEGMEELRILSNDANVDMSWFAILCNIAHFVRS